MAMIQHAAIAAGFTHALSDPDTFARWQAAQNDPVAIAKLIQETLGLAQPPSAADIEEMRKYTEQHLREEHQKLAAANTGVPHMVGFMYTMQS